MTTSFTDNYVVADSVKQLYENLAKSEIKVVESGERNHSEFYNFIDEIIAFTRHRKLDLKRKLLDTRIMVRGHTMSFNSEATRYLKVYLDTGSQSRVHKYLSLEKARMVED